MSSLEQIGELYFEFLYPGDDICGPIARDDPSIIDQDLAKIVAIDLSKIGTEDYDQSSQARRMISGDHNSGKFSFLQFHFSSPSQINGICFCVERKDYFKNLKFDFYDEFGHVLTKKCVIPGSEFHESWFFARIDLSDIVKCEITFIYDGEGEEGKKNKNFSMISLFFVRKDSPEEFSARKVEKISLKKLWSTATSMKPQFLREGSRFSPIIPFDDPRIVFPHVSMVTATNDAYGPQSEYYDESENAQRMLVGKSDVWFSHLTIPFSSPSSLKGALISIAKYKSSPSLLFIFTLDDGTKICRKYEFPYPYPGSIFDFEWNFLPIALSGVVSCEVKGKGRWAFKQSRCFYLESLVFVKQDITIKTQEKTVKEEPEEK
ncbi:hypothetical protein ADUPG1_005954 [Aduncisulcus paluster]|uniref:Uncharacterized protein n=1 Tax=Aduncisulcus paluster TaxID=2918883 RepID=A0ABQ5KJR2_9EUKA|nr:hypothetical protein ADUPG1_005954 [Aduncisulcus paluster]